MRIKIQFILSFLFCSTSVLGQTDFKLDLKIGNYHNDHYEKKFYVREQNWIIEKNHLIYKIQDLDRVYADTLKLEKSEVDSIHQFVLKNKLNIDFEKKEKSKHMAKYGRSSFIHFKYSKANDTKMMRLRADGSIDLEKTPKGKYLKLLENYFYQIVEDRNTKKKTE